MKLDILYFARLKDSFGMGNEQLETEAASVDELLTELRQRGGNWSSELAAGKASAWHATRNWCGWMPP
jgi:molybdopterin synthase sulfur carrier subunit